jgi:DNA-binding SARP family transcriptional activator
MPPSLRISLLGGFSAAAGEGAVTEGAWRLRKSKSLVKLLALAPEHRLHRERASELLWPDRDAAAAANNLHQALFVARRALEAAGLDGASAIELRDDALLLVDAVVDVEEFEQAASTARGSGDKALCRAAVALYGGELLPEDRYEPWADARRTALTELHTALCLELAELAATRRALWFLWSARWSPTRSRSLPTARSCTCTRAPAVAGRRWPSIKSRRTSPTGDERHNNRRSGPAGRQR